MKSRQKPSNRFGGSRVLIVEDAIAGWVYINSIQIFDHKALHAPIDLFGSTPPTVQFCVLVAFEIPPMPTSRYFSRAVQNHADIPAVDTLWYHVFVSDQVEITLYIIETLRIAFAGRAWVLLLYESNIADVFSFDQPFVSLSRHSLIICKVLGRQRSYHALPTFHCVTKIYSSTVESLSRTVGMHYLHRFFP